MAPFLTFLGLLIAIGVILWLSYVFSKLVGQKFTGYGNSVNMKVVDRIAIDREKSLAIVAIGSRYYLIGIGASEIRLLQEVPAEEIKHPGTTKGKDDPLLPQFQTVFSDMISKIKR